MAALRNSKAHGVKVDDPERAFKFIGIIRLLVKLVDEAKDAPK